MIKNLKNYKSKITTKMFIYVCSLLLFNLFMVVLLGNLFLTGYTLSYREDYISKIYKDIANEEINSEKFINKIENLQYENIYINCYDLTKNECIYTNTKTNEEINEQYFLSLINKLNEFDSDFLLIRPTSEFEENIYNITGRLQQLTLFGENSNNKYIIIQTPYKPVIDISETTFKFYALSTLVIALISILPTLSFSYVIAKPIKEATKVARKIKEKDFSEKCIIRTNDEIAELEEAINSMEDAIKTYTFELKSKNELLNQDINNRKKIEQVQKEFVSNVSHELKTPISIIQGYAEALKQGIASTPEEQNEFLDIISDECNRMINIVTELISLSKMENGSISLDYSDFNINELCEIIISKFKMKCKNANLYIKLKADKEYFVRADYNEIEKVLINYVQNAYKHTFENGTISIIIKQEGEYVYIGVNNDGNQIKENDIDHLWDKFYKVDKSHKRENNSTGLGLSIVKATMLLHKMPYGVKNTDNGVEFFIKLAKGENQNA